jgi:hypothetical protein
MYLRVSRQKRRDGTTIEHFQLAESIWNPSKKRSDTKIVHDCGRVDDPEVVERLRRLAKSILRRCSPEEVVADDPSWRVVDAWPYGDIYVLEALWRRLGIAGIVDRRARRRKLGFAVERALFAMVANRAVAPCSKLYCYEQWLREDVRVDGTEKLQLQHLYRAMDFLESEREEIEREIFFHVSDLLSLDVDLLFYDTTSLHFEVDEEDGGDGATEVVLEILEDREGARATIVTSQLDPPHWHEHIGDPTIADAILDRVVHRAYKMKLLGPSKRRTEEEKASSKPAEASPLTENDPPLLVRSDPPACP